MSFTELHNLNIQIDASSPSNTENINYPFIKEFDDWNKFIKFDSQLDKNECKSCMSRLAFAIGLIK